MSAPPPVLPTPSPGPILRNGLVLLLVGAAVIWYAEHESAVALQAGVGPVNRLVLVLGIGGMVAGMGVLLLLGAWRMRVEEPRRRNSSGDGSS